MRFRFTCALLLLISGPRVLFADSAPAAQAAGPGEDILVTPGEIGTRGGQTAILDYKKRKHAYDRVQELIATYDPVICLVSPNILVGAKTSLAGGKPSVMRNYLLWDAEQLFWRKQSTEERRQAVGRILPH